MEQLNDILLGSIVLTALAGCIYLYVKAVIDIHKRKFSSHRERAMWLNIVILTPVIGSVFYFSMKKQAARRRLTV